MNGGDDIITYNDLINIYDAKYDDGKKLWNYEKIIDHIKASGWK